MLKEIRKNYKRLVAFLLSITMIIMNMGGNAITAFAGEEREISLFMAEGEKILEAAAHLQDQEEFTKEDLEEMGLDAPKNSIIKKYEKLFLPEEGKIYELDVDIDDHLAAEGTELRIFYHSKEKEVIFLFLNESNQDIDFCVNIDGYETELVTVASNTAAVEAGEEETSEELEGKENKDEKEPGEGSGKKDNGTVSGGNSGGTSASVSGGASGGGTKETSGNLSGETSDDTSDKTSESTSKDNLENTPEGAGESESKVNDDKADEKVDEADEKETVDKADSAEVNDEKEAGEDEAAKEDSEETDLEKKDEAVKEDSAETNSEKKDEAVKEDSAETNSEKKDEAVKEDSAETNSEKKDEAVKEDSAETNSEKKDEAVKDDSAKEQPEKKDEAAKEEPAEKQSEKKEESVKEDTAKSEDRGSSEDKSSEDKSSKGESAEKSDSSSQEKDSHDKGSSNDEGKDLSLSNHKTAMVFVSLDALEDLEAEGEAKETEPETAAEAAEDVKEETQEEEAEEITEETAAEVSKEETKEETTAEQEPAEEEKESQKTSEPETAAEVTTAVEESVKETAVQEESAGTAEETVAEGEAQTEEESTANEVISEIPQESVSETLETEEITEAAMQEETSAKADEETTLQESIKETSAEQEEKADGAVSADEEENEVSGEDDGNYDDWEIPGKAYDAVTIRQTITAKAYCVDLEDVKKAVELSQGTEEKQAEFHVDYLVNVDEAAEIIGDAYVAEGEDLYFAVEPKEGFEIASVHVNGNMAEAVEAPESLEASSSWKGYAYVYRVEDVVEDLEIVVEIEEEVSVLPATIYHAETDDAMFTISVPGGAFLEAVDLHVKKIEDEEQLKALADQAEEALEKQKTVSSLLAYDISFVSQETGEEVEPKEAVSVNIQIKEAMVSEKAKKAEEKAVTEVSVVHLPENGTAEVVATTEDAKETNFEFAAESFSIYAIAKLADSENVAVIGETYFESIQKAIDSIDENDQNVTIELLKDVTENIVSTEKSYTLDMNGHTVNGGGNGSVFTITNKTGGMVTLKNGTITGGKAVTGGGIRAIGTAKDPEVPFVLNVESCRIIGNTATGRYGTGHGGGVSLGDTGTDAAMTSNNGSVVNGTWKDTEISGNIGGGVHIHGVNVTKQQSMKPTILVSRNKLLFENVIINNNTKQKTDAAAGINIAYASLTANNCTIAGNGLTTTDKAGGVFITGYSIVDFNGGTIENNAGKTVGGLYWAGGNVTINGTVIKGNVASSNAKTCGVYLSGTSYCTFEMLSGAIYGNGTGNDIYIKLAGKYTPLKANILAANAMQDPAMGDDFFKEYEYAWTGLELDEAISKSGKGATGTYKAVAGKEPSKVAKIDDQEFMSLAAAVTAAQAGETIELIPLDEGNSVLSMLDTKVIEINKELIFDLKGVNFSTQGKELFYITDGGKLTLCNTGASGESNTISGTITTEKGGQLVVNNGVVLASEVNYNGDSLVVSGEHKTLNVSLGEGKTITAGDSFAVTSSLNLTLDTKILNSLNGNVTINDVTLITGCVRENAEKIVSKITVKDLNFAEKNITVVVNEEGNIVLRKSDLAGIYLDGDKGEDSNSGLASAYPVKTFQKAAELLAENTGLDTIYVVGPINVSGVESWTLPEGKLKRYEKYDGTLIKVAGTLTLSDIVIDGAGRVDENQPVGGFAVEQKEGAVSRAALITVFTSGTLNMNDGAVLQNNIQPEKSNLYFEGGGVTNYGTLNMSGGKIQYNHAYLGGGVHNRGNFYMSGGEISNNTADGNYGTIGTGERGACGGGVYVIGKKNQGMEMTGGTISNNKATGTRSSGAGISLGSRNDRLHDGFTAKLVMDGGTITKNHADGWGGGINMSIGEAYINKGDIISNSAQGSKSFLQNDYWIGGGIYVDKQATLHIKNVEIADNTAQWGGGGIAACPTATVEIYRFQGGVIHDNRSRDVYSNYLSDIVINQDNYRPEISINGHMLGGGDYNWRYSSSKGEGKLVPYDKLHQKKLESGMEIYSDGDEADIKAGASDCDVRITGNNVKNKNGSVSARGGGIAVNGHLILGEAGGYRIIHTYFTEYMDGTVERDGARKPILKDEIKLDKVIATDGTDVNGRKYVEHLTDYQDGKYEFVDYGLYYALKDARDVSYDTDGNLVITGKDGIQTTYEKQKIITGEDGSQYAASYSIKVDKAGDKTIYLDYVRKMGGLSVSKTVVGEDSASDREWMFDLTLLDEDGNPIKLHPRNEEKDQEGLDNEMQVKVLSGKISSKGSAKVETVSLAVDEEGRTEFALKDGQTITIEDLLPGTRYRLIERDANKDGFVANIAGAENVTWIADEIEQEKIKGVEGSIIKDQVVSADFINTKTGTLTISKKVEGCSGTEDKEWMSKDWLFTLKLFDKDGNPLRISGKDITDLDSEMQASVIAYEGGSVVEGVDAPENGTIALENGETQFALKHGQSITLLGLPVGTAYEVIEQEANKDGYVTTINDEGSTIQIPDETSKEKIIGTKGNIAEDQAAIIGFTNTKTNVLTISKVVEGDYSAYSKDWMFTLKLMDKDGNPLQVSGKDIGDLDSGIQKLVIAYEGGSVAEGVEKPENGTLALENGETQFALKHGQCITILGLPAGTLYEVIEQEANQGGYATTVEGETTVKDGNIIIGSKGSIKVGKESTIDFVNTLLTARTVKKAWDDQENQDGLRPESITVQLLADGLPLGDSLTLSEANNWEGEWKNLPKYKNGKEITYEVQETSVLGRYTASISYNEETEVFTVTNRYVPEVRTLKARKVWEDHNNQDNLRPANVEVQLMADDEPAGNPVILNEENQWSCEWKDLPSYKNGKIIAYRVVENTVVENYSVTYSYDEETSIFTITNTHTPEGDKPNKPSEPTTPENPTNPSTPENPTNPGTPENPTNPGNPGNSNPPTGGRTRRDRTPSTPQPPTTIPQEEVPLTNFEPEEVPLASLPSDNQVVFVPIEDEGIPLFGLPRTGDRGVSTGILLGMMISSFMVACGIHAKRRKEKEE